MTWAKVDDGFIDDLKVGGLSWAARGVWVTGLAWCARKLSDGRISIKAAALMEFPQELIDELVAAHMWDLAADGNGWVVHNYLNYNPSKAEVVAARESAKQRMGNLRDRRGKTRSDSSNERAHRSATPDPDPVPRRDLDLQKSSSLPKPTTQPALEREPAPAAFVDHAPEQARAMLGRKLLSAVSPLQLDFDHCGRWKHALAEIAAKPPLEWESVQKTLKRELAAGKSACLTPQHLVDYWRRYVDGDPPRAKPRLVACAGEFVSSPNPLPDLSREVGS